MAPGQIVLEYDLPTQTLIRHELAEPDSGLENLDHFVDGHPIATLFLHKMRLPNSTQMLVRVDVNDWYSVRFGVPAAGFELRFVANEPEYISTLFSGMGRRGQTPFFDIPRFSRRLKLYAGQIDPSNPSHFTFVYDVDGRSSTVDGWLDNAGQLLISARPNAMESHP